VTDNIPQGADVNDPKEREGSFTAKEKFVTGVPTSKGKHISSRKGSRQLDVYLMGIGSKMKIRVNYPQ
jgi:hypothetical protein